MHSERTELHLQHMVERIRMGMTGEESQIADILFDEVYTLVRAVYKEDEKSRKLTKLILQQYIQTLADREVLDVHKSVQVYAVVSIYNALCKNHGDIYTEKEEMQDYAYAVIADDSEFEQIADTYELAFESVHAYKQTPKGFQEMKAAKMMMFILYAFEKCTVNEISRTLKIDEEIVKNEIYRLKCDIIKIGSASIQRKEDRNETSHVKKKQQRQTTKDEEMSFCDVFFPNIGKSVRLAVDLCLSVIAIVVYFIIF